MQRGLNMEANLNKIINMRISETITNLRKNNINAVYVPGKEEALALLKSLLISGETIGVGGSVTLDQIDAMTLLRSGEYNFLDRYDKSLNKDELFELQRKALAADTFICSTNAITQNGYLYNVDGRGSRAAAFVFGPKRVLVFAGYNKIVPTLRDAVERVKNTACPANCVRLDIDSYCMKNGHCFSPGCDNNDLMATSAGECEKSICCSSVITGHQNDKNRITVVIIGEMLGY